MRISEDKGPSIKSDGVTLKEIKALVDNMFKEILQSYINRERQYLEELAYLRSNGSGGGGVKYKPQQQPDFGGGDGDLMVKC